MLQRNKPARSTRIRFAPAAFLPALAAAAVSKTSAVTAFPSQPGFVQARPRGASWSNRRHAKTGTRCENQYSSTFASRGACAGELRARHDAADRGVEKSRPRSISASFTSAAGDVHRAAGGAYARKRRPRSLDAREFLVRHPFRGGVLSARGMSGGAVGPQTDSCKNQLAGDQLAGDQLAEISGPARAAIPRKWRAAPPQPGRLKATMRA